MKTWHAVLLGLSILTLSMPALADKNKHPNSSDIELRDLTPAPAETTLIASGYFSVDSIAKGPVNIKASDKKCPKDTHAYLDYAIRDTHINESGNTQGYYTDLSVEEDGDGYAVTGIAYEIDDSSDRPHDWVGINWKIWCTADKIETEDQILSERIREGGVYGSTPRE